jgi:hypothetical protein
MSGELEFLKGIGKLAIFGLYPEYKSATVKVFEERVKKCYDCEFCKTVKSPFKEVFFKDRCVKGLPNADNFDIYDHAKYEISKCPIDKW